MRSKKTSLKALGFKVEFSGFEFTREPVKVEGEDLLPFPDTDFDQPPPVPRARRNWLRSLGPSAGLKLFSIALLISIVVIFIYMMPH